MNFLENEKDDSFLSGASGAEQQVFRLYHDKTSLENSLHSRQYITVGGIPEAVHRFLEGNRDLGAVYENTIAQEIKTAYRSCYAEQHM